MEKKALLRKIPNMNDLLESEEIKKYMEILGKDMTKKIIQEKLEEVRNSILDGRTEDEIPLEHLKKDLSLQLKKAALPDMKKVINATGTILHTNLGRAPLSGKHMDQLTEILSGYSNLEYDLEKGSRGERYSHFSDLLCRLTGAEAAMAVNNNAAAVLLMLSALGKGKEAIVSRGELVEIGGKFRIPDVMEQSGTMLREVGTTNKTHLEDYENAITEETCMILKVHTSNYQIVGFTESVELKDLTAMGKKRGIPVMADLGSGVLLPLENYGLPHEPTVRETVQAGADLVCFSADKLLGGPQAGIIVGKKKYLDILKRHPLTRALRIDKFTAAALEMTLREYMNEKQAVQNIPVLRMIAKTSQETAEEAEILCEMIQDAGLPFEVKTEPCESQIGGGAFPTAHLSGKAVVLGGWQGGCQEIADAMEQLPVPIICRCTKNQIVLDVRTIDRKDYQTIVEELKMIQAGQQMECL
ncbi:MAG: L-seryl-tRNA(Sec) selenium transferase [Muricoprocola sp.]